jgi:hypothetical protein
MRHRHLARKAQQARIDHRDGTEQQRDRHDVQGADQRIAPQRLLQPVRQRRRLEPVTERHGSGHESGHVHAPLSLR